MKINLDYNPAKQKRSEQNHIKILQAGLYFLSRLSLDEISVGDIVKHANCSIGIFYQRFKNKESFFRYLVSQTSAEALQDAEVLFNNLDANELSQREKINYCVDHYIQVHQSYYGLIRSTLLLPRTAEVEWSVLKSTGYSLHNLYIKYILGGLKKDDVFLAERLMIGFQIVSGHLVNSIIHPDNKLPLGHEDLSSWMAAVIEMSFERGMRK